MGLRGIFAVACAVLTLPVFGLLAFTFVPPLVSTIWLGVTYSFAAVSSDRFSKLKQMQVNPFVPFIYRKSVHFNLNPVFQSSMWPSIPLVVPQATLGTAMGLATSIQMVGIGVSNLVVGQILGTKSRYDVLQIRDSVQMLHDI